MHTPTTFNQTDHTGPALHYDGTSPDEYLSDSDSYIDESDLGSDDYNNYKSNYESDNEEASYASTSTTKAGILTSSPKDISDDKGSLDCLPIYSFLFLNEKGFSLYNAYDRSEVENKLVIKIDQDTDHTPKFSVANDISEVYGLFEIHECINSQKPLRAVINIDASQEDMEATDNGWNDLNHTRVQPPTNLGLEVRPRMLSIEKNNNLLRISVSSDILQKYADLVLQKYFNYFRDWTIEEKDSENFVYFNRKASLGPLCKRIHDKDQHDEPGKVFECDPSIAEKIRRENKNTPQSSHKVKAPRKTYILENLVIPDDVNLLVLSTRHSYSNAVTTRLNLKSYYDIDGNINFSDHKKVVCQIESLHRITNKCKCSKKCKCSPIQYDLWLDEIVSIIAQAQSHLAGQSIEKLYKLIQETRRIIVIDNDLTDLNVEWIKNFARIYLFLLFIILTNLRKTDFPELRIKEYHGKSDLVEKAHDFSNVEESWKDVDLVAYTSILKIGVSCTNPKFEQAFCLFNSYIESNAGTNQMLFRMCCIKDYICHIEQRSSNILITEEGLFQWLLSAKRECLPQKLQNRGIFPDVDSIIQNKDIPTIRLEVGMIISTIESFPKLGENVTSLSQVVKVNSTTVKAEEISEITNANILDHETAELLENKPRKTLEEMRSLDQHYIVDCYQIPPELLTEDFISEYENYNHMKWFRAYRQLQDAGTNNETAVEAIARKDYREDRLTITTCAERHQICLELLRNCTPARVIDNRLRYKANDVKTHIDSPESISYLQDLVPKMAQVFDNTDVLCRAKKSGLKIV
ncbi:hypothetical protein RclHR1_09820004 [Rhizophagus clarus]|uniref:Replication origin-binding protein domain-containing protein n=1 Tax=Rhizophagus clarus TaxID=94130 RepID=A0A2Z6SFK4_9GLOM|nr:hypothetical protein RclHR1_09820004 [Rhizophagus clarus]